MFNEVQMAQVIKVLRVFKVLWLVLGGPSFGMAMLVGQRGLFFKGVE